MTSTSATIQIRGACPHDCPDTCATVTEVDVATGRAVRFGGDPDHPITQGWLCAKVRPYLERVYAPDRVLYPMKRGGRKGEGRFERISWDQAIDEIASRWKKIIVEQGAAAILPYTYSGTLGLVELGVAGSRFWNRMGASAQTGHLCDGAAEEALKATIGGYFSPDPRDVLHSKLVLIWAHNPASTNPHFVPLLREAQRNGAKVVVVDPRKTLTARSADQHIRVRPGTDAALALAMMHVIFRDGLHAEAWLEANTIGWRELRERAMTYAPERVAGITGVPAETIEALAREYATTRPALLKVAHAVNRHQNGGQTVRALACLPAVAGQMGIRGGGLFFSASGHAKWDGNAVTHAKDCPPPPREVNMVQLGANLTGAISDPPIRSIFIFNCNPVATVPNTSKIVEGLSRDDLFTVVHEQFMTDTALYADLLLPATTQLERVDLHRPYGHHHLQYNAKAIEPLGESISNWDLIRKLATAMGYTEPWLHQTADEVIDEIIEATKKKNPLLREMSLERFQREGTVPFSYEPNDENSDVPFHDGRFPTPSGKMEIRSERIAAQGADPIPDWTPVAETQAVGEWSDGLVLLTGAAHHFVTSSMANQPSLLRKEGTPFIEINPEDAAERGIVDGATVVVENDRGSCQLRAVVTSDVTRGVAVSPKGRWAKLSPDGRNVNWTTSDGVTDFGLQAVYHSNMVRVRPATVAEQIDTAIVVAAAAD
jgi:anaerobic selenocysteine-containing dehydrogenase